MCHQNLIVCTAAYKLKLDNNIGTLVKPSKSVCKPNETGNMKTCALFDVTDIMLSALLWQNQSVGGWYCCEILSNISFNLHNAPVMCMNAFNPFTSIPCQHSYTLLININILIYYLLIPLNQQTNKLLKKYQIVLFWRIPF